MAATRSGRPKRPKLEIVRGDGAAPVELRAADLDNFEPPDSIILGEVGKAEWRRVVAEFKHGGVVLAEADQSSIGVYCAAFQMWHDTAQELAGQRQRGVCSPSGAALPTDGGWKANPTYSACERALAAVRAAAAELGISPASRQRLMPAPQGASGASARASFQSAKKYRPQHDPKRPFSA